MAECNQGRTALERVGTLGSVTSMGDIKCIIYRINVIFLPQHNFPDLGTEGSTKKLKDTN